MALGPTADAGAGVAGEERRHNIRDGSDVHVHAGAGPAGRVRARGRRDAAGRGARLAPRARRAPPARQHAAIAHGLQAGRRQPAVINSLVATLKLCYVTPKKRAVSYNGQVTFARKTFGE